MRASRPGTQPRGQATAIRAPDFAFVPAAPTTVTMVGWDGVNLVAFRSGQCSDSNASVPDGDPRRSSPGACAAKYDCWEHDIGLHERGGPLAERALQVRELDDGEKRVGRPVDGRTCSRTRDVDVSSW